MSGLICWCGNGLHVENETPFCDSCGTVYSCVEQAKKATTKTIERNTLFLQSKNVGLKLADQAKTIAALEREVEALRSLLSDVTCVAITMLYDTHKQDVLDEFTMADLKEVVRRSEHLQIEKVEHIYRRGFEALAAGEAE